MANKYGHIYKSKREEKRLTQRELSERLHVTQTAVSCWEHGKSNPRFETLVKLSELLDIQLKDFK